MLHEKNVAWKKNSMLTMEKNITLLLFYYATNHLHTAMRSLQEVWSTCNM